MIIGITGMIGAGKGTVVDYLKGKGYKHYSARHFIEEEIIRRGLPLKRDSMTDTADHLRKTYGPSYIIAELYKEALEGGGNAIIESIRALGELELLRTKQDFVLFGVDADPHVRFERIRKRGSVTDDVSFEKFMADEAREDKNTDPSRGNLSACLAKADYVFQNNGSIDDLKEQVEQVLKKMDI